MLPPHKILSLLVSSSSPTATPLTDTMSENVPFFLKTCLEEGLTPNTYNIKHKTVRGNKALPDLPEILNRTSVNIMESTIKHNEELEHKLIETHLNAIHKLLNLDINLTENNLLLDRIREIESGHTKRVIDSNINKANWLRKKKSNLETQQT